MAVVALAPLWVGVTVPARPVIFGAQEVRRGPVKMLKFKKNKAAKGRAKNATLAE